MQCMGIWLCGKEGMNTESSFCIQTERICSSAVSHAEERESIALLCLHRLHGQRGPQEQMAIQATNRLLQGTTSSPSTKVYCLCVLLVPECI